MITVLCVLVGFLAACIVAGCNRSTAGQARLLQLVVTQNDKIVELSSVEMVATHLRKYGVAPYLADATVEQVVNEDVAVVMQTLGCDRRTAQSFLIQRTVGPKPTTPDNEVPSDGGPDRRDRVGEGEGG